MKCQILFSGKNKKNIISLSSAENAQRVVKVKYTYFCIYLLIHYLLKLLILKISTFQTVKCDLAPDERKFPEKYFYFSMKRYYMLWVPIGITFVWGTTDYHSICFLGEI